MLLSMSESKTTDRRGQEGAAISWSMSGEKEHETSRILITEELKGLSPPAASLCLRKLLQKGVGPIQVPGGRWSEAPELADGLAHGAGVVGQALDVLKGQVDDLVAAGVAVEVSAGKPLQARLVGDAALAVGRVRAQRQGAGQGAALQAARLDGALLRGRPAEKHAAQLKRRRTLWPRVLKSC